MYMCRLPFCVRSPVPAWISCVAGAIRDQCPKIWLWVVARAPEGISPRISGSPTGNPFQQKTQPWGQCSGKWNAPVAAIWMPLVDSRRRDGLAWSSQVGKTITYPWRPSVPRLVKGSLKAYRVLTPISQLESSILLITLRANTTVMYFSWHRSETGADALALVGVLMQNVYNYINKYILSRMCRGQHGIATLDYKS